MNRMVHSSLAICAEGEELRGLELLNFTPLLKEQLMRLRLRLTWGAFLRGTLYSAVFAMTQQATAGSFFLDGSTLPPDTDPRNDLVNGNPKVVGDFDWFTDAPDTTQRPNQPTANNTTPVDSNFRVVQGDPAVPNVIGQYAPLGAGNKGLYMASRGSSTNNGTNSQRQEVEYQLGAGDNAQTLGARFQVLRVNNASVPTDGYAFHPGLGLLELGASGTSAFAALTVNDDGSDHYRYDVVQVRPFASGAQLATNISPLNSSLAAGNTSQTSGGWMDAWIYTDNTGNVEVELKDEFLNAIVYHATFNGLPGNTAGSFGSAFFVRS